jgi:hypothetical protein
MDEETKTRLYEAEEIEALFVQTAHGMAYDDGIVTLTGLAPTTLMFSDRPDRVTAHVRSKEFVESWTEGNDSFESNPPNAVLSIFQPNGVQDVVVVLMDPKLKDHELAYQVEILDGEMPDTGGECALFIDVIGRPLSPVSLAGMNRRDRRRDRRR